MLNVRRFSFLPVLSALLLGSPLWAAAPVETVPPDRAIAKANAGLAAAAALGLGRRRPRQAGRAPDGEERRDASRRAWKPSGERRR